MTGDTGNLTVPYRKQMVERVTEPMVRRERGKHAVSVVRHRGFDSIYVMGWSGSEQCYTLAAAYEHGAFPVDLVQEALDAWNNLYKGDT